MYKGRKCRTMPCPTGRPDSKQKQERTARVASLLSEDPNILHASEYQILQDQTKDPSMQIVETTAFSLALFDNANSDNLKSPRFHRINTLLGLENFEKL